MSMEQFTVFLQEFLKPTMNDTQEWLKTQLDHVSFDLFYKIGVIVTTFFAILIVSWLFRTFYIESYNLKTDPVNVYDHDDGDDEDTTVVYETTAVQLSQNTIYNMEEVLAKVQTELDENKVDEAKDLVAHLRFCFGLLKTRVD